MRMLRFRAPGFRGIVRVASTEMHATAIG
jgi:hypothetical protein